MLSWMVIYPRGDRTRLDIAQVRDYERDEWALASPDMFEHEVDARKHMLHLAEKHNKIAKTDEHGHKRHDYLD